MGSQLASIQYSYSLPSPHSGLFSPLDRMSSPLASSSSSPSTSFSATCRGGIRLAKPSIPATQRSSPRHMLKPGPLGLGKGGTVDESSALSRLRRQQFRQKCQEAMARDRRTDRRRKVDQGRHLHSQTDTDSDEEYGSQTMTALRSDDLSSSDMDEETKEEQEMEIARRILAVDYRRMMREMERSGQMEVGWLDPDEVAWLEEEVKREEAQARQQEPPTSMLDEDEELFAQYQHAQNTVSLIDNDEGSSEDDFSWLDEEDLQRAVEGAERNARQAKVTDDVVMSDY